MDSGEAHVTYSPTETSPPIIAECIGDMGFPSKVKMVSPVVESVARISPLLETAIHVDGMTCMSCVRNIEENMSKVKGIESIKVNLEEKQAYVRYNAMKLTPDDIAEKISDMGFDAYMSRKSNSLIARIHVEGMTCQNCANTIESFVKKKDGVEDIRVSLQDKEAFIIYKPSVTNPVTLKDIICDMGFEATLPRESALDLEFDGLAKASIEAKEKETMIDIEGMVCMSCVKNIEGTVSEKPGILQIRVSLEDKNGWVRYNPSVTNPEEIARMIDDMGFDSKVSKTAVPSAVESTEAVTVGIKGMTCQSCVKTIQDKISDHPGVKSIKVSLENESGLIVYYPTRTTPKMLADAIDDMGFEASVKGKWLLHVLSNYCYIKLDLILINIIFPEPS